MTSLSTIPTIRYDRVYIEWTDYNPTTSASTISKFYFDAVIEEKTRSTFDFSLTPTLRTSRVYNAYQETGFYRKPVEIFMKAILTFVPKGIIFQNGYEYLKDELSYIQRAITQLVSFQDITDIKVFTGGSAKYATLESIARSGSLLTVRTTTATYSNMGISNMEILRSTDDAGALYVSIAFTERRQENIAYQNVDDSVALNYSSPKKSIDQSLENTNETSADLGGKTKSDL